MDTIKIPVTNVAGTKIGTLELCEDVAKQLSRDLDRGYGYQLAGKVSPATENLQVRLLYLTMVPVAGTPE